MEKKGLFICTAFLEIYTCISWWRNQNICIVKEHGPTFNWLCTCVNVLKKTYVEATSGLNSKAVAVSKMWLAQLVAHVNNLLCMLTKTCNIQIVQLAVALISEILVMAIQLHTLVRCAVFYIPMIEWLDIQILCEFQLTNCKHIYF